MRVVDLEEMKQIEKTAIEEYGFTEDLIIENVGLQGAHFLDEQILSQAQFSELIVLVGLGNNGADGLSIARHLVNLGHSVRAFLLFPDEITKPYLIKQIELAKCFGVKINEIRNFDQLDSYFSETGGEYFILDAVIGTGFRLPLSNYLFDVINAVNQYASVMVALDIPSGVMGDTGRVSSTAIKADITLAIGLPKLGHYISDGAHYSGQTYTIDAGFPRDLLEGGDKSLLSFESILSMYTPRNKFAHKNSFGHALIVGGSQGLTGALIMASKAALRVGTGLVTASTWSDNYGELASRIIPEIMTGLIPTEDEEIAGTVKDLKRYHAIVIGPGLGRQERSRDTVLEVLNNFTGPIVLDADAIKMLSLEEDGHILAQRKFPTILTPHMGEFAHFVGSTVEKVSEDPITYLKDLVDKTNSTVILKGPCTFLGFPNGEIHINYFPNDGMATGGSGDVLAGILGGLLAQIPVDRTRSSIFDNKKEFYRALKLGVAVHTLAGKHAAEKVGERAMSAGSIIEHLTDAFRDLEGSQNEEEA